MAHFLFKYPWALYRKGEFAFLSGWPVGLLLLVLAGTAATLALWLSRARPRFPRGTRRWRLLVLGAVQWSVLGLLMFLAWKPGLYVSTLKPGQNIIAVLVDDSQSMAIEDAGSRRIDRARALLENGLLEALAANYQTRLYRVGTGLEPVDRPAELQAQQPATRLSDALKAIAQEASRLPIGAVVLLSDGADTAGGVDRETISMLRSLRLPVHTVGFGDDRFRQDVELMEVEVPARALPHSKLPVRVGFRQHGFDGQTARLVIRAGGQILASESVRLAGTEQQFRTLVVDAGPAGPRQLEVSLEPLSAERNARNNALVRLVQVEDRKARLLYMEGEPRWEYKFIRRALEEDAGLELVSIVRTTQNKIYRQGISQPDELKEGFPQRVQELFEFDGLILGSIEASYFTAGQIELIREFVDRRGGGLLFLAGRAGLGDGGWGTSSLGELLPVVLPAKKPTFHRERAAVRLTSEGADHVITRLAPTGAANRDVWQRLPKLADYQEVGEPKPGAVVLTELLDPQGKALPLLVIQRYGHGRVAVLATGGTWRWQMQQPLDDRSHEVFWQQLARWLVTGALRRVSLNLPGLVLFDETSVEIRAQVRDSNYLPASLAEVKARVAGPDGSEKWVELRPLAEEPGVWTARCEVPHPGLYVVEIQASVNGEAIGQDVAGLLRQDGVLEHFRTEQNRHLLEQLAKETGGRYFRLNEAAQIPEEIAYSEAGIAVREFKELWDVPALLLLIVGLKAGEWYLRRRWGVV